jgi:hypothetical protein
MAEIADMLMVDQNEAAKVLRALAARCAVQARELAELRVPVERDKYLCRLLVEWYVRVNDGEDHAAPAEHILRGLVRYADERQQAVAERDARIAELEERMTRARSILTNGHPTPDNNWGLLDVSVPLKEPT